MTISFVTYARLSICLSLSVRMEKQLRSHWTELHEILHLNIFRKSVENIRVSLKSGQEYRVLYIKTNVHFLLHLVRFYLE
jgi:hypothetical protein